MTDTRDPLPRNTRIWLQVRAGTPLPRVGKEHGISGSRALRIATAEAQRRRMVLDLVEGNLTVGALAEKHGMSERSASRVLTHSDEAAEFRREKIRALVLSGAWTADVAKALGTTRQGADLYFAEDRRALMALAGEWLRKQLKRKNAEALRKVAEASQANPFARLRFSMRRLRDFLHSDGPPTLDFLIACRYALGRTEDVNATLDTGKAAA